MRTKKKLLVAFQGEHGAYSDLAARKFFGEQIITMPTPSFDAVFEAVAQHKTQFGIVPLENSIAGTIHRNYDLLARSMLTITGEIFLRISHHLLALPSRTNGIQRLRQIKRVYSHSQALDQCERFIRSHPWMEAVMYQDTAAAVRFVAQRGRTDEAAIASNAAANLYGLTIIADNLETNRENYTRFCVISIPDKKGATVGRGNKVSILLTLPNVVGSLSRFLVQCAGRGMNLTKVESRPLLGKPWEYLFYADFEHSFPPEVLIRSLKALRAEATNLIVLGTYDKGTTYRL